MDDKQRLEASAIVGNVFSPGAPIDRYALFAGRTEQVGAILDATLQRGQHAIVFGERGVGKTSLANVLAEILKDAGLKSSISAKINCDGTDDFSSVWHKVFRGITVTRKWKEMGFVGGPTAEDKTLDTYAPEKLVPDDIRHFLSYLESSIIIIDEVDRIKNHNLTALLADTVKTLSDHSVDSTLVIVGVADTVDGLIAQHQSIERALVQIRMPRMSPNELLQILDKALDKANMTIDPGVKGQIARLSMGLPRYTHLLGLHAAKTAIANDRRNIIQMDLDQAICIAVDKAQESIRDAYHKAISSPRKTLYPEVLLACALAPTDFMGYFAANDVRGPMTKIMGRRYEIPAFSRHLYDFCEPRRGPVLQKTGSARRFRFRFINPLMQPFVIMDGVARRKVDESVFT
jgi:Cdc6-like AAA superfamily ATPase